MPQLNSKGEWCAGFAGAPGVSWGIGGSYTVVWAAAGGSNWLDDDNIIANVGTGGGNVFTLMKYNVRTMAQSQVDTQGANTLWADAGVWAAWAIGGVRTSTGLLQPTAGVEHVGPDGAICMKDSYQGAGPFTVYEKDGSRWQLTAGLASGVRLLGSKKACWTEGGKVKTIGSMPTPNPMTSTFWWLRMLFTPDTDGWWVLYQESTGRLVLHPATSSSGYILAPAGSNTYAPDMVRLAANKIRVVWSVTEGEEPYNIVVRDVDPTVETRTVLGSATPPTWVPGQSGEGGEAGGGDDTGSVGFGVGTVTLRSESTFEVIGAAEELITLPLEVWPAYPAESGHGRIIHPTLGAFDYETKPDEWVNIDADAIITPVWASTRTLTSSANVLWQGNIRDVVVEERWKALGGLAMPITQLRMLLAIWTTPVDPDVGYVHWYPNYITSVGFKILPVMLTSGGQGVTFDDVVNYKDEDGDPIGWMTNPVTFTLKLVARL